MPERPATRFGTFEELLAGAPAEVRALAYAVRRMVRDVHPEATEVVRLGERAATYGLGPRKNTEGYAYVMPTADAVNLGFFQGAVLPDPAGMLEGTGKRMRHVKVHSHADVGRARPLVAAALAERRAALGA